MHDLVPLLVGACLALIIGLMIGWCSAENYIGMPTFGNPRNWSSGASQRHSAIFSSTNQGYPGNMATTVGNLTYAEEAAMARKRPVHDESLVGTYQEPNFPNPARVGKIYAGASMVNEEALHHALLTGEHVSLHDMTNQENYLLGAKLM
jgi:hypothetical protein